VIGWLSLAGSFAVGALIGLAFFWGLWATVNLLLGSRATTLRILASLVLRFGAVLGVFYLLARYGGWQHLLLGALGFTVSRLLVVHRLRPHGKGAGP
jgi:F1F0 ATPase subunit 2